EVAGVVARLKWPNDLVVDTPDGERKLSGLLAEADWPAGSHAAAGYRVPRPDERLAVVVGIGVNVDWPRPGADGVDPELEALADTATALSWLGAAVDRVDLLVAYLRRLEWRYGALVAEGPADLLDDWRARSATLGRRVRGDLGADDVEGAAADGTAGGHLVVHTLAGGRRTRAVVAVGPPRPPWPRGGGGARGSGPRAWSSATAAIARRAHGPSTPGSGRPSRARSGCTSRVVEVSSTSSASARAARGTSSSSASGSSSSSSSRVTPARQPDIRGGVSSRPSRATKTLVPVPSHRFPAGLPLVAAVAPPLRASASATTCSA